jgi:hypothetical protein
LVAGSLGDYVEMLGTVADNEIEDLQKKVVRIGGNVALLTPQRAAKAATSDYRTT